MRTFKSYQCLQLLLGACVVLLSATIIPASSVYPVTVQLNDGSSCGLEVNLFLYSDLLVTMRPGKIPNGNYSCSLTVKGVYFIYPQVVKMRARFRSYSMNSSYRNQCEHGNNIQSIEIISPNGTGLPPFCGKIKPSGFFDLEQYAEIRVSSTRRYGHDSSIDAPQFDILITPIVIRSKLKSETCPTKDYIDCKLDDACLPRSLVCNGVDDCGNGVDETGCSSPHHDDYSSISIGEEVGIAAVCFVMFVIIVVVVLIFYRRYKRRISYQTINN
ncbi:uncharacterized protein LOC106011028 [Aplysia californica]|uniref:Uncharacterized protein LOC106011028 n=1 Tax=Aplysia californica TaxID=6500 RepID=A0ABM0ZUB4_APLCA|nr:uncharacterized protein LOC106011028 [Aplysia californica]